MDDRAFDNLVRLLGGARSRRQVLRRLGTGLAGALAGAVGLQQRAGAVACTRDQDCGATQYCETNGQCVCHAELCRNTNGCCDEDQNCRTEQSEDFCGRDGSLCAQCSAIEVCQDTGESFACVCQREDNPCGSRQCGIVTDRCGNSHLCGADGNTADCPAGQTCDAEGVCHCTKASCGAINGCCASDETCKTANSNNFCGKSGDACAACTGLDTCDNSGVCACEPEANPCGNRECGEATDRCGNTVKCGPNNGDCANGRGCCSGACVDLTTDKEHCGTCAASPCTATQVCSPCTGSCSGQDVARCCPTGKRTNCGGKCVNLKTDENNCGRCGKQCKGKKVCKQGDCV
jgi:hypothetical protein